jgi:hypothetical protein
VLQPLINFVEPLLARLKEADMEGGRISDLGLPANLHARQGRPHAVVVGQERHVPVPAHVLQTEVFCQECPRAGHVGGREIEVIQRHDETPDR